MKLDKRFSVGLVFSLASVTMLSGCSSMKTKHSCPLPESCAPIHDVYESATKDESPSGFTVYPKALYMEKRDEDMVGALLEGDGRSQSGGSTRTSSQKGGKAKPKKVKKIRFSQGVTPGIDANGAVWHPPQPYWVWLAHWVDETGVLHSGSYAWFTSKGYWTIDGVRVETSAQLNADDEERADFEPAFIPDAPVGTAQGAAGSPSFSAKSMARELRGAMEEFNKPQQGGASQ